MTAEPNRKPSTAGPSGDERNWTMAKCYLLALIEEEGDRLVVRRADIYSSDETTTTHDLHRVALARVMQTSGDTFQVAYKTMLSAIEARLDFERQHGISTILGRVCALVKP